MVSGRAERELGFLATRLSASPCVPSLSKGVPVTFWPGVSRQQALAGVISEKSGPWVAGSVFKKKGKQEVEPSTEIEECFIKKAVLLL